MANDAAMMPFDESCARHLMNTTLFIGLIVSVSAFLMFSGSIVLFLKAKTIWSFLRLVGAGCLLVVGLCHICEAVRLFPWMRWGLRDSVGHYLNLWSALLGLTLFPAGYIGERLSRPPL
jgi:hypothetical protein